MGQKTNPIGNRLGYIQGWESNWFGGSKYGDKLVEDDKIRKYLKARLVKASISKIIIERTLKLVTVTINTARPGVIIGKGGQEVDKLKEEVKKLIEQVKDIQDNLTGPLISSSMVIIFSLLTGLVVSLVTGLFLKRKRPE